MAWELEPMEKVILIVVSAATIATSVVIVLLWIVTACRPAKKDKDSNGLTGVVYGTAAKSGVNLTNFSLYEDSAVPEKGVNGSRSPPITEGTLVGKLATNGHDNSATSSGKQDYGKTPASRQDSSYYSMSSGRASPASVRSGRDHKLSISSEIGSPPENLPLSKSNSVTPPCSSITISLLLTHLKQESDANNQVAAKLAISVESVTDLPSREYRAHCDPWVSVTVLRDRRSLRRRPPASIAYFRTKTIRHAHNPFYSQTFVADLQKNEIKDVSVRFTVMDQDRHTGPREIGRSVVSLKEAKQTVQEPERSTLTLFLSTPKPDNGEIQFGLSYLPTAQRLSISLVKATNLRFDKEDKTCSDKKINPYAKLMLFSQSGRLVKKKKSSVKYENKDPVFDETINFEAEPGQLDTHTLMIIILSKQQQEEVEGMCEGVIGVDLDSSDQESYYRFNLSSLDRTRSSGGRVKDPVLGVIYLGRQVRGDRERDHWIKMMDSPRKVFSVQHTLR